MLAAEGFCSLAQLIEGRLTRDDILELGPELKLRIRKLLQVSSWFRPFLPSSNMGGGRGGGVCSGRV